MSNNINHIRNQINIYFTNKKIEHNKKRSKQNQRLYGKYYQSSKWKDLRSYKFIHTPYCEVCDRQGIVKECDEVHHLHVWRTGKTEEEKWQLLLDYDNLCSCCSYHHHLFHDYLRRYNKDQATIEELLEYEKKYEEFIK